MLIEVLRALRLLPHVPRSLKLPCRQKCTACPPVRARRASLLHPAHSLAEVALDIASAR